MSRELTIPELIETLTRLGRVLLVLFFLLVVTGVLVVWQRRRVRRQIAENEQDLVERQLVFTVQCTPASVDRLSLSAADKISFYLLFHL